MLRDIRIKAFQQLEQAGSNSSRLDVELLLAAALGLGRLEIILEPARKVSQREEMCFQKLLARRVAREPLSQILGRKDFWSLSFRVSRHCLTPRPDSETLIETALKVIPDKKDRLKILDLGTGDRSGRIRTYNFPQGRVTDHRINLTLYKLDQIVAGDGLEEVITALITEDQAVRLADMNG